MKPTVYIETTVISYLAASPSRDLVVAAHQQITHTWWNRRDRLELLTSQAVLDEASRGDTDAAARRIGFLAKIPVLTVSDEVIEFAEQLLQAGVVPAKVHSDAIHIAVAAMNHIAYLLHGIVLTSQTPRFVARSKAHVERLDCRHPSSVRRKN